MSTSATIAVMHGSDIKAIYCHYDGYLEGVGETLLKHYNSARANHLVSLGDLSQLSERIEPTAGSNHCYGAAEEGVCVFYGRDRLEEDVSWQKFGSVKEWVDHYGAEFSYIINDGVWYVCDRDGILTALEAALAELSQDDSAY